MFHKSVAQRLNTLKSFIHLVPCVRSIRGTLYDNAHFMSTALSAQCFSLYTCVQRGFLCAAREDLMCTLRHSCMTVVRRGLIGDIRCKMIKEREPELHHSVLVRSGNSILFPLESSTKHLHPRTTTTITTTRSSRPSQLREHVVAADM